jgi:hypothetical protein
MTLPQITEFFGWVSVLNVAVLFFATIILVMARSWIARIHSKIFGIPESELAAIYFNYIANYKTLTLIFAISPYITLKVMGY